MNADEIEIHDFLKTFPPNLFVSVNEISKRLGVRKRFDHDRTWARPMLRRMELDGVLEANEFGEYRVKGRQDEVIQFKDALYKPMMALGDTTIITLRDSEASKPE